MPKKETLADFAKRLHLLDNFIIQKLMRDWNRETLVTMSKAQYYSPVDTSELQGSARKVNAKITDKGLESKFIFAVPYAKKLEGGENPETGEEYNINQSINPNAQAGYSKRAMDENAKFFMEITKKAISKAFDRI